MTAPQDPQQVPNCQDPASPYCVNAPVSTNVVFVCGGEQQIDQCVLPSQTGTAPAVVVPVAPVVTVPASTPAALQLPSTGSPSAPIAGCAGLLLVVGIVFTRIGRLTSAR